MTESERGTGSFTLSDPGASATAVWDGAAWVAVPTTAKHVWDGTSWT